MAQRISRRGMLVGGGAAAAMGVGAGTISLLDREVMPGALGGADFTRGHRLREGRFGPSDEARAVGIVIVGGGIAGLAAGWALAEAGFDDFVLLELEDRAGGNARSGRNAVSRYPLGAHYLPIPNTEARSVRHLLEKLGIITGWQDGEPLFDPYQLVSDPHERLLHLGRWQEGLVPTVGLTASDRHDLDAFFAAMIAYRDRRDTEGRPAFAIPMALSARDPDLMALDRIGFTDWLHAQGWHSPILHAHVRYACRDDYGTEPNEVSAWAGIHYFASRRGVSANSDGDTVLTWPEGNDRLAEAMAARIASHIHGAQIVHGAERAVTGVTVRSHDVRSGREILWRAGSAVLATPHFVTARLLGRQPDPGFSYAPWIVANVTVDRLPAGSGVQLAWDNVSWTSPSLGYVVATHQSLAMSPSGTVLTWYMPLSDMPPAEARRLMLSCPLQEWQDRVEADLLATNPDLKGAIRSIDIWRWGHAMIRPVRGFLWGGARETAGRADPPLFFAHSDLSGFSIFEEAHYRGTLAAEAAMRHLGHDFLSMLDDR